MSETITGKELMRRWAVGTPQLRSLLDDEGVAPISAILWDAPEEIAGACFKLADVSELERRYPELKAKAEDYEQEDCPSWWKPDDGVVAHQGATMGNGMAPTYSFAEDEARRLQLENTKLKEEVESLKKMKGTLSARERWKRSLVAAVEASVAIVESGDFNLSKERALKILQDHYDFEGESIGVMAEAESLFWNSLPQKYRKQRGRPKK